MRCLQQEGTLIGTALLTCFGYWASVSAVVSVLLYVFVIDMPLVTTAATLVSHSNTQVYRVCVCTGLRYVGALSRRRRHRRVRQSQYGAVRAVRHTGAAVVRKNGVFIE